MIIIFSICVVAVGIVLILVAYQPREIPEVKRIIHLPIKEKEYNEIIKLQNLAEGKPLEEIFNDALTFYISGVEGIYEGMVPALVDEKKLSYTEIMTPLLVAIKSRAEEMRRIE